ncbi:PAS domain-containing sensor histidine kinase [Pseudomonas aeruginosa]|uniref:PAS domain-containing sensor histidine kinase n=1 Tax=Pseudomonas aeruginosa TaxID=287 RepID=UPI001047CA0C|nr:PAS domain-containing sensor histidine kinase [Pseudomonas aeruginosa]
MSPLPASPALNSLLRLLREGAPLVERVGALRRLLLEHPGTRQAWYLAWQPQAQTYTPVPPSPALPPGAGEPNRASDLALRERLVRDGRLALDELRRSASWLGARLRRAGVEHGMAFALDLQAGDEGLLLVASDTPQSAALDWLGLLLAPLLAAARGVTRAAPFLAADPQPALLLDGEAQAVEFNQAFLALLGERPREAWRAYLPANHGQLVRASLGQARALGEVEAECDGRILLWQFIPDSAEARVLARCRDATASLRGEREAARASRLYRLITENTTDLISRHTLDGIFLDASPASWTLLGYWPEELRGRPAQALFHPQDRGQVALRAREALEQDGYLTITYRIRHRDGRYRWFETASRAIRETYTGAVVEVVSVSRDVTRRVEAEENRRRLAEVVEANTDLVLFVEHGGRVTYLNPSARAALGIADGQEAPYYSLVARDMTERELREAQQRRHQDELAHTARLVTLGELASGIAHEINQPLAAVMNYASASQRYLAVLGSQPEAAGRVAEGLARIGEHAGHAAEVIKRLRAFLRKGQRRLQALDLNQVAREAIGLCAWEAGHWQVAVEEAMTDNPPPLYADRVLLEQVFLNLLRNAIEANREAHPGSPSRVVIGSRVEPGGLLCLWVRDQGPGVPADQLEHIFTPFHTSKPEGLGLGLSMSRSIVEGFGGTLEAELPADGGLLMNCRLPLAAGATGG